MKITEIFYSIQGEGMYTGVPSIFIRTFGCNLKCCFCDSLHSIVKIKEVPIVDMTPDEIYNKICEFKNCQHVVITGGEPLLQLKELKELMQLLYRYTITIETNGTIWDDTIRPNLWSVSPKTSNSLGKIKYIKESKDLASFNQNTMTEVPSKFEVVEERNEEIYNKNNTYENLKHFVRSGRACQFKFVINDESDLKEIQKISLDAGISKPTIYLMPEGKTVNDQREKSLSLIEICKNHGYNFCTRLHIWLWGDKRGV